jgi:hypothetical protein
MTLVQAPEVKVVSLGEPPKFFYMPLEPLDLPRRSTPEASSGETPTDGKVSDNAERLTSTQRPAPNDEITKLHPIDPGYIPKLPEASEDPSLTAFVPRFSKKVAGPDLPHPTNLTALLPGNGGTNTEWFGENAPITRPLHSYSAPYKAGAIHGVDDHISTHLTGQFLAAMRFSSPQDHLLSVVSWLPPFTVAMLSQKISMRN